MRWGLKLTLCPWLPFLHCLKKLTPLHHPGTVVRNAVAHCLHGFRSCQPRSWSTLPSLLLLYSKSQDSSFEKYSKFSGLLYKFWVSLSSHIKLGKTVVGVRWIYRSAWEESRASQKQRVPGTFSPLDQPNRNIFFKGSVESSRVSVGWHIPIIVYI